MAKRQRRMFTAAESAEVWDRWQRGEGLNLIGRIIGRRHTAVFAHLKPTGGIRPAARRRSRRVLSLDDREEISRGSLMGDHARRSALKLPPSDLKRVLRWPTETATHCGR